MLFFCSGLFLSYSLYVCVSLSTQISLLYMRSSFGIKVPHTNLIPHCNLLPCVNMSPNKVIVWSGRAISFLNRNTLQRVISYDECSAFRTKRRTVCICWRSKSPSTLYEKASLYVCVFLIPVNDIGPWSWILRCVGMYFYCFSLYIYFFSRMGIKLRISHMLRKYLTTELFSALIPLFIFRQGLTKSSRLAWHSLCSPDRPRTCHLPASTS